MAKEKCRFKSAVIRPRTSVWTIAKSRYILRNSRLSISRYAIELHCSLRVGVERLDHALRFGWATDLWENLKDASLLTRSNALVRLMKAMYKGICCFLHLSCNCQREKIMSIVDRPARKPHCDYG